MASPNVSTAETGATRRGDRGLRARFYLLAALLIPLNTVWVLLSEVFRYAGHPSTISLFYNVVFWLCLLLGVNALLRRAAPRAALNRDELLGLYVVLGITTALGGHDLVEVLLPILARPAFYADNTNRWAENLLPRLPSWLVVLDKPALDKFYSGHSTFYLSAHLLAWWKPVLAWTAFLGTLAGVMLCLNVLLRKQWTEREKLAFPLVQLPLELTAPGAPLLKQRLLWVGFAVAVGLQLWNGVAALVPSVPALPLKYQDIGPNLTQRPWSAAGWIPIGFYPFAIALGILLPLDLSFSSWFFFLFWKAQYVVAAAYGWDRTQGFPYVGPQSLGAYLGIAFAAIWAARSHFARIARHFLDPAVSVDDADEPISYRAAVWGVLVGLALLVGFCLLAGMSAPVIAAFFTLYLGLAVAVTRMRADLGPPVHDLHQAGPEYILPTVLGPTNLRDGELVAFSLFYGFNRAYRAHPMPIQLEGFKMAERTGQRPRALFFAMLAAGFVGTFVAFWALLHLCYQFGAASGAVAPPNVLTIFGTEAWNRYNGWVGVPQPPQPNVGIAITVGAGFTFVLNALRLRVMGFPFHPVGYAVASSWGMSVLWVPMLLAWATKFVMLRYGGLGLYRRALPFFFGVILGECIAGSLWSLLGIFYDIPTYAFWP
jgi:hypothetical protein